MTAPEQALRQRIVTRLIRAHLASFATLVLHAAPAMLKDLAREVDRILGADDKVIDHG